MIIVTGGAGFIGSNLIRGLNRAGHRDILVVDNLQKGEKFVNLLGCDFLNYQDKKDFWQLLREGNGPLGVTAVFHQGACSDTTEWDGRYMMRNNVSFSQDLLHFCEHTGAAFIYASSAAVYGCHADGPGEDAPVAPLNVYGFSKWVFDQYVQKRLGEIACPVVGLRYFNVYGPGESHKGAMASLVWQWQSQLHQTGKLRLFGEYDGFGPGEHRRDFIAVDDVVAVNLWCLEHPELRGVINVGTGESRSFNDLARAVIQHRGNGDIEYIPFPDTLMGRYQSHTRANLQRLRKAGFSQDFLSLEAGVSSYLDDVSRETS